MAEPHLSHPGETVWYPGHGPAELLGSCPHATCPHNLLAVIAEGPDFDHYVLDQCDVPDDEHGCDGSCRAWAAEWPALPSGPPWWTDDRPQRRQAPFLLVGASRSADDVVIGVG